MNDSPNEQVRQWIETAERPDLLRLVNHMMEGDVRAAILAYQYVSDRAAAAALSDTQLNAELARLDHLDPCIHPGVFATGRPTEHCHTCGTDVPMEQL
jgi:hypothetical protein